MLVLGGKKSGSGGAEGGGQGDGPGKQPPAGRFCHKKVTFIAEYLLFDIFVVLYLY